MSAHTSPKALGRRKSTKSFIFSSPIHKKRFLRLNEQKDNSNLDENQLAEKKISLSTLILKHKEELGLKKTVQVIKEMHKKSKTDSFIKTMNNQHSLQDIEQKPELNTQPSFDPETWGKINIMVKDVISPSRLLLSLTFLC